MAIELSPRIQSLIAETVEQHHYPDADTLIEHALEILDEERRSQSTDEAELKRLIAEGVDAVQQGRVREFTPELREALWQQALEEAVPPASRARRGAA